MDKSDLYEKRRQLSAITNAANSLSKGRLSPCTGAAIIASGAAAFVAGPALQFGLTVAFGTCLGAFFLAYQYAPFPKSWAEALDNRLTAYEPVDHVAYANLHEATKAYGGLDLQAVFEWLDSERHAIGERLPKRSDGTGKRFMSKDVSDHRAPRK